MLLHSGTQARRLCSSTLARATHRDEEHECSSAMKVVARVRTHEVAILTLHFRNAIAEMRSPNAPKVTRSASPSGKKT